MQNMQWKKYLPSGKQERSNCVRAKYTKERQGNPQPRRTGTYRAFMSYLREKRKETAKE